MLVLLGVLLAACGANPTISPTASPPTAAPPSGTSSAAPLPSEPSPSERVIAGLVLPEPGPAFDAATLLDAMRTSRRPGGVPDQLEIDQLAGTLAETLWTYGGEPWTTMAIGGSCGTETCSLEVAGTRPERLGEDLWVFEIVPGTGRVTVVSADLSALPTEIVDPLDDLAHMLFRPGRLDGLVLASVRWLPPPSGGQFVLSYRSGGEEGSCGADITIDAILPEIVDDRPIDC